MHTIELDASKWKGILDFYDALLTALRAPKWHGRSVNALIDSIIEGGINQVEPPYVVQIRNVQNLPRDVFEELDLTIHELMEARAWHRKMHGDDVLVDFELPDASARLTPEHIKAVEKRLMGCDPPLRRDLRYGFFKDFKGSDTLLFFGSSLDLTVLADALRDLEKKRTLNLWSGRFWPLGKARVTLELSETRNGCFALEDPELLRFKWALTPRTFADVMSKVDALVQASGPGHQYFVKGSVPVIISKDEYPDALVKEAQ